jgi:hypothetical protein
LTLPGLGETIDLPNRRGVMAMRCCGAVLAAQAGRRVPVLVVLELT